jgi:hypothetical protein
MKGDKNQLPDKRFKIYGGGVPWQTNIQNAWDSAPCPDRRSLSGSFSFSED